MTAFHSAMAAVAYAEEGEFNTAREILGAEDEKNKTVLLGVNDLEIKPKLIKYAYELSQRVGGQLEVVQILSPSMADRIFDCMHDTAVEKMKDRGIAYKIVTGLGTMEENLLTYAQEKRNVLLVLLKNISNEKEPVDIMDIMDRLHCPVVVFSEVL